LLSKSRNPQFYKEPEGSLLPLQEFATGPYPGPDKAVHTLPSPFFNIHLNIIPESKPSLPSDLFPSDLLMNIFYAFLISLLHSTYAADLIILDFLTVIIIVNEYKL
jgi:hypothetical protein